MKRHQEDQLLRALLVGEDTSAFREASLERTLLELRHRQRRRATRLSLLALMPVLAFLVLLSLPPRTDSVRHLVSSNAPGVVSPLAVRQSDIEYIGDEELFRLFPDRSMALIGRPGDQRLMFLGPRRPTGKP